LKIVSNGLLTTTIAQFWGVGHRSERAHGLRDTIRPNAHICGLVARQASAAVSALGATPHNETSGRTDLDSHANMVVLGKDCFILSQTGLQADVNAFTPDHQSLPIPIVNGAKLYIDPYTGTKWIIVFKHALTVPTMENDLVPPFLLREAGIEVNETAKIHMKSASVTDHSIYFPSSELRIPLSLHGMFSYFPSYKPTMKDLEEIDEDHILLATPDGSWNPHSDVYATNEENMLDWDGNIVPPKDQVRIMLDDLPDDSVMAASVTISSVERAIVDRRFQPLPSSNEHSTRQPFSDLTNREGLPKPVPPEIDKVYAHLKKVSPTLVPQVFEAKLTRQQEVGHFSSTIGSCNANYEDILFPEVEEDLSCIEIGSLDFDDSFEAAATFAGRAKGVGPSHLAKVWRIDLDTAKRTIDATTQLRPQAPIDSLSRNYPTNDRMLRYRRIHTHFFMDTFFATSKARRSSRGHTCMQLFVTDKPLRSKSQVPAALKIFAKAIGAPDAIVADCSGEQTSKETRAFLQQIGTSLQVLEKGTQWANRAELYIGLIKEAVRKDMKQSGAPIVF
jgi:hypothetical protein